MHAPPPGLPSKQLNLNQTHDHTHHTQDSYQRTSSHASSAPMYGIDEGSVLRTVLTGRDAGGNTWLQFEGAGWSPFRRPRESFIHMVRARVVPVLHICTPLEKSCACVRVAVGDLDGWVRWCWTVQGNVLSPPNAPFHR